MLPRIFSDQPRKNPEQIHQSISAHSAQAENKRNTSKETHQKKTFIPHIDPSSQETDKMSKDQLEDILKRIEQTARSRYLPIIGPRKAVVMTELIRRVKPKRVLEVGTLIGYSAIVIGKELESDAEIISIEIDKDEAELARENIQASGIKPTVQVLNGDALQLIPKLSGTFDFVFLDAAKDQYLDYLRLAEPMLHRGTVIAADNARGIAVSQMLSLGKYLRYVRKSRKYESKFIQVGWDGIEISTRL